MEGRIIISLEMNGDIRIYYKVEGDEPPLMLHHGISVSLASWRDYRELQRYLTSQGVPLSDIKVKTN